MWKVAGGKVAGIHIIRRAIRAGHPPRGQSPWTFDVAAVLRNRRVLLSKNMYSVIFDFKADELHLASGGLPAAERKYRTPPLF
ncbi:hypothetical protein SDC9_169659 [bioreactor metagenome]|uniref:Uncharacterized protein n=1 Tax=bioreactor metagenome TaxID=1076179 RepID=A0A645G817_9ZZZZ